MAYYLVHGWNWSPETMLGLTLVGAAYAWFVGRRGHPSYFVTALVLAAITLLSPLNLLATGVLFSAHMAQHIILLLFVPALLLLSLPSDAAWWSRAESATTDQPPRPSAAVGSVGVWSVAGWLLGVGSMWFWHIPQLCDAAATSAAVHTLQTTSLIGMGAAFWWPILSPRSQDRLLPGYAIGYLFTACLACTSLGILITLTPVEVCSVFSAPSSAAPVWANLRTTLPPHRDQQVGGLLMWLPMCLVYVAAIVIELFRWFGARPQTITASHA